MSQYYFFRENLFDDLGLIEVDGHTEITGKYLWTNGEKFPDLIPRETILLDPAYGIEFPDFFDTTIPIMSKRLIDAIRGLGITNFDEYPVILKNKETGEVFENYSAINVIGAFDLIDLNKSKFEVSSSGIKDFSRICLKEEAGGKNFFRLDDGPDNIVVNEETKQKLLTLDFKGLLFQKVEEWDGI